MHQAFCKLQFSAVSGSLKINKKKMEKQTQPYYNVVLVRHNSPTKHSANPHQKRKT